MSSQGKTLIVKVYNKNNVFKNTLSGKQLVSNIQFSELENYGLGDMSFAYSVSFGDTSIEHNDIVKVYNKKDIIYTGSVIGIERTTSGRGDALVIKVVGILGLGQKVLYRDSGDTDFSKDENPAITIKDILTQINTHIGYTFFYWDSFSIVNSGVDLSLDYHNLNCNEALKKIMDNIDFFFTYRGDGYTFFRPYLDFFFNNLILYYNFLDNVIDQSGNSSVVTDFNTSWSTDHLSNALGAKDFNGSDSYIETDILPVSGAGDRTMSVWVKLSSSTGARGICGWGGVGDGRGWRLETETGSGFRLAVNNGNRIRTDNIEDNNRHHVVVIFSGSTSNDLTAYVDGVLATIDTTAVQTIDTLTTYPLNIGRTQSSGTTYYGEVEVGQIQVRGYAFLEKDAKVLYNITKGEYIEEPLPIKLNFKNEIMDMKIGEDTTQLYNSYTIKYGSTSGGTITQEDPESIALYGTQEKYLEDSSIANEATAEEKARSELIKTAYPKLNIRVNVNTRYNLEDIHIGDTLCISNIEYAFGCKTVRKIDYKTNSAIIYVDDYQTIEKSLSLITNQ